MATLTLPHSGRPPVRHLVLSPENRAALESLTRRRGIAHGLAQRCELMLLLDQHLGMLAACREVRLARRHGYKWLRRYLAHGIAGLQDLPHPGPPPCRGPWQRRIVALLREAEAPLTTPQIREALGRPLPVGTRGDGLWGTLHSLVRHGVVVRGEDGAYALGEEAP